jgi:hypothetical protein
MLVWIVDTAAVEDDDCGGDGDEYACDDGAAYGG